MYDVPVIGCDGEAVFVWEVDQEDCGWCYVGVGW